MIIFLMINNFAIYKGMTEQELWVELDRIGISGETRQEVVLFKEPEPEHMKIEPIPLHNVVLNNDKYAVLAKSFTKIDPFGKVFESWSYFFCGINDEGKYFIRPLKNFPFKNYKGNQKPTIEDIADWVNRIDEHFDVRVQGDVLAKFIHIKDMKRENDVEDSRISTYDIENILGSQFGRQQPLQPLRQARRTSQRRSLFSSFIGNDPSQRENVIEIQGIKYSEITDKPLKLGNHKLFTEGSIFASREMPYVCVIGESLILQHYEHAIKELVIPHESLVILAAQRGRDFETKNLNYLKHSYD